MLRARWRGWWELVLSWWLVLDNTSKQKTHACMQLYLLQYEAIFAS